jgi:uncharacterized protein YvpB
MNAVARPRTRRAAVRRRRLTALVALAAVAAALGAVVANAGGGGGGGAVTPPRPPAVVKVNLDGSELAHAKVKELSRPGAVEKVLTKIPARRVEVAGKAKITYAVDRGAAASRLRRAVREGGGTVVVPERAVASTITVPLIPQTLQNDCEVASLSMVLGYAGHPVGQLALQGQVVHAKPLDPSSGPQGEEVWGDPALGFVGRADGGGPAGGFGVYQGPIRALARVHGLTMTDLSGQPPAKVYASLLAGHPVLAWVALSAGPYATWTSPAGKSIKVNYGEHAVVLTGVEAGAVDLNDPLSGTRTSWSKPQFEEMWAGLGHRALAA